MVFLPRNGPITTQSKTPLGDMSENRFREVLPGTGGDTTEELSEEVIFDMLQNSRRRYSIDYLKQENSPVELRTLVDQIAAWETDKEPWEVSSNERQRVHVSLLQSHIPALSEAGLVQYDREAKTLKLTEQAESLDMYLEVFPEGDIDWGEYYWGVLLFNTAIFGLAWFDFHPFGAIPAGAWVIFVPTVFLLAATLHYWVQQKHQLGSGLPPNSH